MRLNKIITVVTTLFAVTAFAQTGPLYPQQYFRNPLNIPISLAGNFGECRAGHFHSGLDIKTQGRENFAVHAAAEGYVSRIKMEKGGFGHAIYITHPNGFTTLYAHLNDFFPALQQYLRKMQYERESWAVDINLKPNQFPVRKGQQIAWSGNTGGSTAPHLHFEIRDTKTEHPLNPQLFGFDIRDTRPPVPTSISLYDLNTSIYRQQARFSELKRSGDDYTIADTIIISTDKLGVGINVNDFMNGSHNTLNFYTAAWYLDDVPQGTIRLDDIGYDVTRYLHAYVDYTARIQKKEWYQLLFRLPGNKLGSVYPELNDLCGAMYFPDRNAHKINIRLTDAAGNNTSIFFFAKSVAPTTAAPECSLFEVNQKNEWTNPNFRIVLDENALYDDVCADFTAAKDEKSFSGKYSIASPDVPVHTYYELKIKSDKLVPFQLRNKMVTRSGDGKDIDGRAADFEDGWYKAKVRNFGSFWLEADTVAPVIKALQPQGADLAKASLLRFSVEEHLTSVKTFRAELDGKWLCFEPKGNTFFYRFDERCRKGPHRLVVRAADENNNERTLVYTFTR